MSDNPSNLDKYSILDFYKKRAINYDSKSPEVSMLLQDSNPELAIKRSRFEITRIMPLLNIESTTRILDVGCGVGRWAKELAEVVQEYVGSDYCEPLLRIARSEYGGFQKTKFYELEASDSVHLEIGKSANLILFAGVSQYISDAELIESLRNFSKILVRNSGVLYLRCPIAIENEFTLNKHYSVELGTEYSAHYRTENQMSKFFQELNFGDLALLLESSSLYPQELQNRKESRQHFWIWKFH